MGNAFLFVVVGLILYYIVLSDKFYCLEGCVTCLVKGDSQGTFGQHSASGQGSNQTSMDLGKITQMGGLSLGSNGLVGALGVN